MLEEEEEEEEEEVEEEEKMDRRERGKGDGSRLCPSPWQSLLGLTTIHAGESL